MIVKEREPKIVVQPGVRFFRASTTSSFYMGAKWGVSLYIRNLGNLVRNRLLIRSKQTNADNIDIEPYDLGEQLIGYIPTYDNETFNDEGFAIAA